MRLVSNIHDEVWVRLTEEGIHYYTDYLDKTSLSAARVHEVIAAQRQDEGWWKFPLNKLMYIFGRRLIDGAQEKMFVDDIILLTNPLE